MLNRKLTGHYNVTLIGNVNNVVFWQNLTQNMSDGAQEGGSVHRPEVVVHSAYLPTVLT